MIKYFKELLATLKAIENHLSKISDCVQVTPSWGKEIGKSLRTCKWSDNQ